MPDLPALPATISGPLSSRDLSHLFRAKSDFSYRLIENVELADSSLYQSLFTGTIVRNCVFTRVDFRRSDLDGTRFEGCQLLNCRLEGVDIRTSVFSRTLVQETRVDESLLENCTFNDCDLINSTFGFSNLNHNWFLGTTFTNCALKHSTSRLNRFERCQFQNMELGDCTFLYAIMLRCNFIDSKVNAESIGTFYGISRENLRSLDFIYLGEKQATPKDGDIVATLTESFRERHWIIGLTIMALNFQLTSVVAALALFLRELNTNAQQGRALKSDELEFFIEVLRVLGSVERLPGLAIVRALETMDRVLDSLGEQLPPNPRETRAMRDFSEELLSLFLAMLDHLQEASIRPRRNLRDARVILSATFKTMPGVSLCELIDKAAEASGFAIEGHATTISVRHGSWTEVISTTLLSVLSLQVLLFLVNGCVIQATELKARMHVLMAKKPTKTYLQEALRPRQHVPAYLAEPLKRLVSLAWGLDWLADPQLKGLLPENIESLEVRADSDTDEGA